jgi:hypothetical protein
MDKLKYVKGKYIAVYVIEGMDAYFFCAKSGLEMYRADLTIIRAMKATTNGIRINSTLTLVQVPIILEVYCENNAQSMILRTTPTTPLAKPLKMNLPRSLESSVHSVSNPIKKAGHIVYYHLHHGYYL